MKILQRQKGMAAVLILLLTGFSLTAMVYAAMAYLRGTQSSVLTIHSATQAQLRAWTGAEIIRLFLEQLGSTSTQGLASGYAFTFNGLSGIRAVVVSKDSTNSRITINITGCSNAGNTVCTNGTSSNSNGATTTIQVVYVVTGNPGNSSNTNNLSNKVLNISGDLDANGGINVAGANTVVNVDGKFTSNTGMTGINSLYATGDVLITGGGLGSNTLLASNKNITLSGSGNYGQVQSMQNVTTSGGVSVVDIKANGNVDIGSNSVTTVTAIGNVTLSGGGTSVGTVTTMGNTALNTGSANINTLRGTGTLIEGGNTYVSNGIVGGAITQSSNTSNNVKRQAGFSVTVPALTAITIQDNHVDATALKSSANYIFEVDNSGRMIVTTSRINGIADGTYFLYSGSIDYTPYRDYLCTSATPSAAQCLLKIGQGFSAYNDLITYSASNKTWTLNGTSLAPGVAWFKGSLIVSSGTYYNTFIASENITTTGSNSTYAINYAAYANICTNTNFSGIYPTNYCKISTNTFTPDALGNIVFLAGSYDAGYSDAAHFHGGNITLGSSSDIYGDLIAGNILTTSGNTSIRGYVLTANQSGGNISNKFGGSTTINLTNLPSTFDPGTVNTGGTAATPASASMLWSRYL